MGSVGGSGCGLCVFAPWRGKNQPDEESRWRGHLTPFNFRGEPIKSKDGITQIVKELEEDGSRKVAKPQRSAQDTSTPLLGISRASPWLWLGERRAGQGL